MQVQSGASDLVLAGGAESMSQDAPFYSTAMRWGVRGGPGVMLNDRSPAAAVTAGGATSRSPAA